MHRSGQSSKARPALIALGFVVSFAFVALALNALATALHFDPEVLRTAGLVLLGFGALMIFPAAFERLAPRLAAPVNRIASDVRTPPGNLGGFVLGTTLGLIWTPCAGPVLGAILTAVATSPDHAHGAILLVTYTIGAALPMLAIAYGGQAVSTQLRRVAHPTPRACSRVLASS